MFIRGPCQVAHQAVPCSPSLCPAAAAVQVIDQLLGCIQDTAREHQARDATHAYPLPSWGCAVRSYCLQAAFQGAPDDTHKRQWVWGLWLPQRVESKHHRGVCSALVCAISPKLASSAFTIVLQACELYINGFFRNLYIFLFCVIFLSYPCCCRNYLLLILLLFPTPCVYMPPFFICSIVEGYLSSCSF